MFRLKRFIPVVGAIVAAVTMLSAIVSPAFAAVTENSDAGSRENKIKANTTDTLEFGNVRVVIDESGYSGELALSDVRTINLKELPGVIMSGSAVRISHDGGTRIAGGSALGTMTIFFKLSPKQYTQWQMGKLFVYHYDRQMGQWVQLPTLAVHMSKNPRADGAWELSIRGVGYGIYSLGEPQ